MWQQFRTSVIVLGVMTLFTGVLYPMVVTLIAQTAFRQPANGSLLERDKQVVGSELIGQPFSKPEYFWGRLSATSPVPYNAASSSGSNLGPSHPDIAKNAKERIDSLRRYDPSLESIPVDLVTASASGLDPHISPAAADVQVKRVAVSRKMTVDEVKRLVALHTEGRQFGILGEPRVNVLALNLALEARSKKANEP
jgi:K+-transporting ATPase ATPase C chain